VLDKNTTRVIWKNIKDFLKITRTPPDHVFNFIKYKLKEDIGWVSSKKSDGLIIHNKKLKTKDLEEIMIKYLKEFVICNICKKSNTTMYRDQNIREMKVKCNDCNSSYTVT
jgi:translation initiation factor 2 subunit 2